MYSIQIVYNFVQFTKFYNIKILHDFVHFTKFLANINRK